MDLPLFVLATLPKAAPFKYIINGLRAAGYKRISDVLTRNGFHDLKKLFMPESAFSVDELLLTPASLIAIEGVEVSGTITDLLEQPIDEILNYVDIDKILNFVKQFGVAEKGTEDVQESAKWSDWPDHW